MRPASTLIILRTVIGRSTALRIQPVSDRRDCARQFREKRSLSSPERILNRSSAKLMSQQEHTLSTEPGHWAHGAFPANVRAGAGTLVTGDLAFKRFHSKQADALVLGSHCTMDGVHFDLGEQGRAVIGDYCYWTNVVLLCELEVRVGNYVLIGWNTTIT